MSNLFDCPDCQGKVSTSAEACPHCGRPVAAGDLQTDGQVADPIAAYQRETLTKGSSVFAIALAILLICLACYWGYKRSTDPYMQPKKRNSQQSSTQSSKHKKQNHTYRHTAKTEKLDLEKKSVAYKFAALNAGYFIDDNDISVNRSEYLLSSLAEKTGLSQEEVSDITYSVWDKIARKKYGINITLLAFLDGMNDSIPQGAQGVNSVDGYTGAVVLFVMLLK